MAYEEKVKLFNIKRYLMPLPPLGTKNWTMRDYIRFIDQHGRWCPEGKDKWEPYDESSLNDSLTSFNQLQFISHLTSFQRVAHNFVGHPLCFLNLPSPVAIRHLWFKVRPNLFLVLPENLSAMTRRARSKRYRVVMLASYPPVVSLVLCHLVVL